MAVDVVRGARKSHLFCERGIQLGCVHARKRTHAKRSAISRRRRRRRGAARRAHAILRKSFGAGG